MVFLPKEMVNLLECYVRNGNNAERMLGAYVAASCHGVCTYSSTALVSVGSLVF